MKKSTLKQIIKESILENKKILTPRQIKEEGAKNSKIAAQQKIKKYIKDGGKGDLDLDNTPITSLPNNLKVGASLHAKNTKLTSLPNGLEVGHNLYLYNTPITSLPKDLKVGEDLGLNFTPLSKKYPKKAIRKMVPGVEGYILF